MTNGLGNHLLACGDATDPALVAKLATGPIDLIATDPTYGVGYVETKGIKGHKAIVNDGLQSDTSYAEFTRNWLTAVAPHLAAKNAAYVFNSDKMVFALREGMLQAGFKVGQMLIWVKSAPVIGRLDYHPQHELILYGWKGTHVFRKSPDRSVLFEPKVKKNDRHPTMKPVSLMRRLILNSSKPGDIVYDPFLGSGTTLLACEQTKRRCIGIELDPEYCRVIVERREALTGETAKEWSP
jgi:DNA modification methylase